MRLRSSVHAVLLHMSSNLGVDLRKGMVSCMCGEQARMLGIMRWPAYIRNYRLEPRDPSSG